MTTLLSIETSTTICSVALLCKNSVMVCEEKTHRSHGQTILSLIDKLLSKANITLSAVDTIAFGRGPGAFTGLRIGIGVVQGLAFGLSCQVAPVSSLQALAQAAFLKTGFSYILTALDARMGEVYFAAFTLQKGIMVPCLPERVIKPETIYIPDASSQWLAVGSGFEQYGDPISHFVPKDKTVQQAAGFYPTAEAVATIGLLAYQKGETLLPSQALPVYLRG